MKLSVSAYRAHASAHKKILTSSYQHHYGSTSTPPVYNPYPNFKVDEPSMSGVVGSNPSAGVDGGSAALSTATSRDDDDDSSNNASYEGKTPGQRTKSNQRWMKLRTTVQLSSAIQMKKPPLKREDSFLKRFSTRQIPETQETVEDTGSEGATGESTHHSRRRRRIPRAPRTVVNPDENFYFYWLWVITTCVLYNLWTLIVRQSFPELQMLCDKFWFTCDCLTDAVFVMDLAVQLRTGYLEQGLMVYDARKLARHYLSSRAFLLDVSSLTPLDLLQLQLGINPMLRFPRFLKVYRAVHCYYMVESRTVYPNFWRVINLIHILLILAHWFGCFYFLLSEAEGFQGDWVYPYRPGDYATLTRKYLGSLYWSTLTLTTIGDLPTPETNADNPHATDGPKFLPRRGLKSRLLQFKSNKGYVFTIVSYLIGVFIFATIVGQVGNVITNRNANRLEFERLLDGAKTYMRHHKVPGGMKRRVLRWYDYSWSRGRIQGGGDINTALGLLPDKLKTELALHVNLSVLKKVTIFQECQPEFLHDLVLKMKAYIFTPGDSICRKGEVAREMFIIADGILEVISETGRVLTTMKAGDFFGEIGILNLDGLNKRTADVRSVGYSELFSLSREDVLAAMKDYPEAQEILQTLGRKRLQEARNCSRVKVKKKDSDENADKLGDDSASKRIVHKLRSDVKGIRNAIRIRSRVSRRSAGPESIDFGVEGELAHKGVLRRMPRVESDDSNAPTLHHPEDTIGATIDITSGSKDGEKSISPIGAGLPLLARLKLLKERQDREEKAVKQRMAGSSLISPQAHIQHASSGTASEEPEIIGAGLPLLQRLLLLKAKEEREKNQLTLASSNPPSSSDTISPSSLKSPLSPTIKTLSPIRKDSESSSPGKLHSPTLKSSRKNSSGSSDGTSRPKVSFRDKILQVQSDGTSVCQPLSKDTSEKIVSTSDKECLLKSDFNQIPQSQVISIPNSVVNKIKSPAKAIGSTFRDKLKLLQGGGAPKENAQVVDNAPFVDKVTKPVENKIPSASGTEPSLKVPTVKEDAKPKKVQPWSKLKKAAIISREVFDDSKISLDSPFPSPKSELILDKEAHAPLVKLYNDNKPLPEKEENKIIKKENVPVENNNVKVENKNIELESNEKTMNLLSFKEIRPRNEVRTQHQHKDTIRVSPEKSLPKESKAEEEINKIKPRFSVVREISKNYSSIDDLSPEYGPLPFVKKLKILNERQKLAELERVIKIRSSSLDCASSPEDILSDTLLRSHSEGSTINRRLITHKLLQETVHGQESNETLERRTLKSILKKLSEDVTPDVSPDRNSKEFRKLIRAPTLEGYAARHSKFSKSVTFNRHTLPSPPTSTNVDNINVTPFSVDADFYKTPIEERKSPEKKQPQMTIEVKIESEADDRIPITSPIGDDLMNECGEKTHFDYECNLETHLDPMYEIINKGKIASLRPEEIRVPTDKPKLTIISAVANQRKLLRGSLEEHEYFGEVLFGIKNVIQGHLHEVQGKFQDRFNSLELEVRRRDEIISQLQNRIQELERLGLGISPGSLQPMTALEDIGITEELFSVPNFNTDEAETSFVMNASSGSDELSVGEQGFMRGDSLDTVFATSPPPLRFNEETYQINQVMSPNSDSSKSHSNSSRHVSDENNDSDEIKKITQLAEGIQLERLSYSELQQLADTLSKQEERKKARARNLDLNLTSNDKGTYSRKKAAKLKQKASWEDRSNDDSMELNDFSRSISPHTLSEDSSLLSCPPRRPLKVLGTQLGAQLGFGGRSARARIKKTLSVDAGMHRTGGTKPSRLQREGSQRKFSLGSWFGYHTSRTPQATTSRPAPLRDDVVLDIESDGSWSDGESSTSASSETDSVPKTPIFEDFVGGRYQRHSYQRRGSGSITRNHSPALGGDWELLMLADELDRREREKEDRRERDNTRRDRDNEIREELAWRSGPENYERILKDLEEESDNPPTPQNAEVDCIMETVSIHEPPIPSTSVAPQQPRTHHPEELQTTRLNSTQNKTKFASSSENQPKKRSSSLILRASSLESQDGSSRAGERKFGSLKGSSSDGHKRL